MDGPALANVMVDHIFFAKTQFELTVINTVDMLINSGVRDDFY